MNEFNDLICALTGLNSRGGGMLCDTLWVELYFGGPQLWCSDGRSATMDRPKYKCKVYYGCLEDGTESSDG